MKKRVRERERDRKFSAKREGGSVSSRKDAPVV